MAVLQKASWKKKNTFVQAGAVSRLARNPSNPIRGPAPAPNISPNPMAQNTAALTQKSIMFLMAILTLLFARTRPVSSHRKPACISKTRKVHSRTQDTEDDNAQFRLNLV